MANTVQSRILQRLMANPQHRAIAFYDKSGSFSWQSREEYIQQSLSVAARMTDLGLRPKDVCVLVLQSNSFLASALLAVLFTGAVPLLVAPPLLQAKEAHSSLQEVLCHIIKVTNPKAIVGADNLSGLLESIEGLAGTRLMLKTRDFGNLKDGEVTPYLPAEHDLAAMQLTSGTTGFPRICVWKQQNVIAALDGMREAMQLRSDDICLNWTPLYHDMGLINNFLLCWTTGTPIVMLKPHDFVRKPALWMRGLSDTETTVTWSPNFGFAIAAQRVRDSELEGVRLDQVRAFWNAAERIHYRTMIEFHQRYEPYGLRWQALKTNFGCAENIGGATFSDPHGEFVVEHVDRTRLQTDRVAVPRDPSSSGSASTAIVGCGKAFPGMRIRILGKDGDPLPDGRVGDLALETPSRMEGYLKDVKATSRAFQDDRLITGDIGYLRDGEFFWLGRSQEKINIHGKKLDPSDFEPVLLSVSGLRHGSFAVFGVDDPKQGTQRIVLVTEVRTDENANLDLISGELRDKSLKHLGANLSEVLFVPPHTLTKTSSGKRRHRHFRELYEQGALQPLVLNSRPENPG